VSPSLNGILKEVVEKYPEIDLPAYLADNLQLPLDKAELLARRIEKQITQKSKSKAQTKIQLFKKSNEESAQTIVYSVGCLSEKEFEYFIKWLLGELGYETKTEDYGTTQFGVDGVVFKAGMKIFVQAIRCPRAYQITEAIVKITQELRGDCPQTLVIATSMFTELAIVEAKKAGIELWNIETINQKIAEAKKRLDSEVQVNFPKYRGTLLKSLLALDETKNFLIEAKPEGKYYVHLPGVKYPLLTFQAPHGVVTHCICRIKYYEPVTEIEGETIIDTDEANRRIGPDGEKAFEAVIEYLEQFLE
jgi:HJR/Mrr/RecB family endonuclease